MERYITFLGSPFTLDYIDLTSPVKIPSGFVCFVFLVTKQEYPGQMRRDQTYQRLKCLIS